MKSAWIVGLILLTSSGCFVRRSPEARNDVMDLDDSTTSTLEPINPMPLAPPEPIAPPLPVEAPIATRKHVVAPGDTLYSLSVKYYGEGKHWPRIRDANPGLIPERMPLGKPIAIP